MRILIALDSFKGTLSASAACDIVAAVIHESHPGWLISVLPMADGGEGTADALVAACRGEWCACDGILSPLPSRRIRASFGWLPDTRTAVVEMARASGLPLLQECERDPWVTTTYGTGQLLREALDRGAREILLTLGGSATNDGGTGTARALGWRFLDDHGRDVPEGGGGLSRIRRILPPACLPNERALIKALCDVDNPLCGPNGAAAVYGPQKGASPSMVDKLDAGLRNLAECVRRDLGKDVLDLPGAGAAGGFGAGAVAFLGADLVPGVVAVADACGLRQAVQRVDWVITGEGRFDEQSLQGKVVCGVRDYADPKRTGVRVAVLAGRVALPASVWEAEGITLALASAPPEMGDQQAFARADTLLAAAAGELAAAIGHPPGHTAPSIDT